VSGGTAPAWAKSRRPSPKGQYRDGYRFLAQSLRSDYLRLIIQKKTVERAVYNLNFLQRQLQQSEERLAKKDISELQIAATRLAAEQAQIATEQVQYDYEMLKASVARMAGRPPLQDEEIPAAVPAAGYDATAFDRLLASYLGQKELPLG
jgi:outer membrane protein TolC